jgi:DNA helicase-2/ATP-dependent DNA helicase PcrA
METLPDFAASRNADPTLGDPLLDGLNAPQKDAVLHDGGPALVFAAAGSGKTGALTRRVAYLIKRRAVAPNRIMAVTFTNKAAGELRERVSKLVGAAGKQVQAGTFHSLCAQLLRMHPEIAGRTKAFVIYSDDEQKTVVKGILSEIEEEYDSKKMVLPPNVAEVDKLLAAIEMQKRRDGRPESLNPDPDSDEQVVFQRVWAAYEEQLLKLDAFDFNDLIVWGMRLATEESKRGEQIRAGQDYVMVDEFQDTDMVQLRLVSALAQNTRNLFVVGDDDQAIYSWRGADSTLIRRFDKLYPDAKVIKLEQNYRSHSNIVEAAASLIETVPERAAKRMFTAHPTGEKVQVVHALDERDEGQYIADFILAHKRKGGSLNDCAVIYRLNMLSRGVEMELRSKDIKYRVVGGLRFFQRAIIKDVIAYVRLVANPASDVDFIRVVDAPPSGVGDGTLSRLRRFAATRKLSLLEATEHTARMTEVREKEKLSLSDLRSRIQAVRAGARNVEVKDLIQFVTAKSGMDRWLDAQVKLYKHEKPNKKKLADVEAKVANLREMVTDSARWQQRREEEGESATLTDYLERVALLSSDEQDDTREAVTLITGHGCKGLQWPHVFVIGVEEGLMPAYPDKKSRAEIYEEYRLMYVAMTRAEKTLHLIHASERWTMGRKQENAPSRFLDALPTELLQRSDRRPTHARADQAPASEGEWPEEF